MDSLFVAWTEVLLPLLAIGFKLWEDQESKGVQVHTPLDLDLALAGQVQ